MTDSKKILIVDQSSIFRKALKAVVRDAASGVQVMEASNAEQATHLVKKDVPDLIFVDISLPGKKGFQFIATIKDMLPKIRIVVLTSHDSQAHETASMQKGADYFLSKEHSGDKRLIDVINTAIRQIG